MAFTRNDITSVDPVLTNMLVSYQQDQSRFIASQLFPVLDVATPNGTYYTFDKKYWMSDEMQERAWGADHARAKFGVSTSTYETIQWSLEVPVADEERSANQAPMDLEEAAVEYLGQKSLIRKERAFVSDFITTSVWDNTDDDSTTDWDDFSSGDPVKDVLAGARTISQATGTMPNVLAAGHIVHNALINHPDIVDRVKYVQVGSVSAVANALAAVFGLEQYIPAMASYNTANEGQDFSGSAIFDDDALLCYRNSNPSLRKPSAGYTFAWGPGGGAGLIRNVRDEEASADIIQIKEEWDQKVVASDMGYLWLGVV